MEEGASTDLSYKEILPPARVERDYPWDYPGHHQHQSCHHGSPMGRQRTGSKSQFEVERLLAARDRETSRAFRYDGLSYVQPWRRNLQERRELEYGRQRFSQRVRPVEAEIIIEGRLSDPASRNLSAERPQSEHENHLQIHSG